MTYSDLEDNNKENLLKYLKMDREILDLLIESLEECDNCPDELLLMYNKAEKLYSKLAIRLNKI